MGALRKSDLKTSLFAQFEDNYKKSVGFIKFINTKQFFCLFHRYKGLDRQGRRTMGSGVG